MVRSRYSLFLLEKMSRAVDFPGIVDDAILLQSSYEGAQVI